MIVNGKKYDPTRGVPPMTAFRSLLKDEELAAVLTFVRNTWENKAEPVDAATVARVRNETIDRTTFWKPEDLLAEHPLEPSLETGELVEEFSNEALETELLAAAPAELAKLAMQRGNIAQGKKLFYESSAACFACHDPPKGAARLGPNLSTMKKKLSAELLVDSLLRPSDLIEKDYAQVNVLTLDGEVLNGIRVSEDDKAITLRNIADPEPKTILQDDIDEVIESKVSIMPANLVRQLKNRQEFDDLMRYVLEIRKR
jgi:putative heme-binding domain-containing protein